MNQECSTGCWRIFGPVWRRPVLSPARYPSRTTDSTSGQSEAASWIAPFAFVALAEQALLIVNFFAPAREL